MILSRYDSLFTFNLSAILLQIRSRLLPRNPSKAHRLGIPAGLPGHLAGGVQTFHHRAVLIQHLSVFIAGHAALGHMVGRLDAHPVVGALGVKRPGRSLLSQSVLLAFLGRAVKFRHRSLQACPVDPQSLG